MGVRLHLNVSLLQIKYGHSGLRGSVRLNAENQLMGNASERVKFNTGQISNQSRTKPANT